MGANSTRPKLLALMQEASSVPEICQMEKHHPYEKEKSPSKMSTPTAEQRHLRQESRYTPAHQRS